MHMLLSRFVFVLALVIMSSLCPLLSGTSFAGGAHTCNGDHPGPWKEYCELTGYEGSNPVFLCHENRLGSVVEDERRWEVVIKNRPPEQLSCYYDVKEVWRAGKPWRGLSFTLPVEEFRSWGWDAKGHLHFVYD